MRKAILILAACLGCTAAGAAQTKSTTPAPKKTAPKQAARHTRSTSHRAPTHTWRAGQMVPTPDRYKEIQDALAKRGYLHKEATGTWDTESADALRRFQHDQNLEPSGKLNSLSLIALGLGPKHEAPAEKPATTQP